MADQDGWYDYNAPGAPPRPPARPWQSNEERLVDEALARAWSAPSIAVRPPPAQALIPPRFGYDQTELNLSDLFKYDRDPDMHLDFSGSAGGYAGGTSTPSLGGAWW
jgi:hypothetical protein